MTPVRSDHFNGKTFLNPGDHAERGWFDVLRWQLTYAGLRAEEFQVLAPGESVMA